MPKTSSKKKKSLDTEVKQMEPLEVEEDLPINTQTVVAEQQEPSMKNYSLPQEAIFETAKYETQKKNYKKYSKPEQAVRTTYQNPVKKIRLNFLDFFRMGPVEGTKQREDYEKLV